MEHLTEDLREENTTPLLLVLSFVMYFTNSKNYNLLKRPLMEEEESPKSEEEIWIESVLKLERESDKSK